MKETANNVIENVNETPEVQTQPIEKPYTFRRLSTHDLFPMLRLLNKMGIKDLRDNENVKRISMMLSVTKGKKNIDVNQLGIDVFVEIACLIVENIPKCEAELYTMLSTTSNLTIDEIKAQDMAVTFEMIVDFVRKEEFGDFFRAVAKLFK